MTLDHSPNDLAAACYAFAEVEFSDHPIKKIERDEIALTAKIIRCLNREKQKGRGKLGEAGKLEEITSSETFTDGWITYLHSMPDERVYFIGDLHGAYRCLKKILGMTGFFEDMAKPPEERKVHLVFLGDYIDRGTAGFHLLRLVFYLKTLFPDHIFLIRGNHEEFERDEITGEIYPAVAPADHLEFLQRTFSLKLLQAYKNAFDLLPGILLLNRGVIGVHGGLPTKDNIHSLQKLADLNDPEILRQMRWSDPAEETPPYGGFFQEITGRLLYLPEQFDFFMEKIGAHYLVRSHEPKAGGFEFLFNGRLLTIFSAGGRGNTELTYYGVIQPAIAFCTPEGKLIPQMVPLADSEGDEEAERKNRD